jgi:hypothetical protein
LRRLIPPLFASIAIAATTVAVAPSTAVSATTPRGTESAFCETHLGLCPDTRTHRSYEGDYVGHDEPAVLFSSARTGSGNSNTWRLQLPHEAPVMPTQEGTGGTWGFQQRVAFWFGMAMCETQSYPNPGAPCPADSDTNIKDSSDPTSPDWIGSHAGSGFMELQFYPPGWTPVSVGTSCDATQWCAAMAIFGLSDSTTQTNNSDCLNRAGDEWANFAFLTMNGTPQAPPAPLSASAQTFAPDPAKALFMDAGDELTISTHDSPDGLVTAVHDDTTGTTGSMTASIANGFAHPLFQPSAITCTEAPYAFHPMYSTSGRHTRVPWAAHSYNVAFSDEIGHFEYCNRANPRGKCVNPGVNDVKKDGDAGVDADDHMCFNPSRSLLVQVGGCIATETDFDGLSYQRVWPGSFTNATTDRQLHSGSVRFASPLSGGLNYERVAFEADLPAIERSCDGITGAGCVNPPPGANFYPIYTTRGSANCAWQQGGTHIPGTVETFGGTSVTEFGKLRRLFYPGFPGVAPAAVFENFKRALKTNPCASTGSLPR